jgi:hypothetical protein
MFAGSASIEVSCLLLSPCPISSRKSALLLPQTDHKLSNPLCQQARHDVSLDKTSHLGACGFLSAATRRLHAGQAPWPRLPRHDSSRSLRCPSDGSTRRGALPRTSLPASVEQLWPPTASKTSWPPPQPLRDGVQLAEFGRIVAGVPMKMETPPPQVPLDIPGSAS